MNPQEMVNQSDWYTCLETIIKIVWGDTEILKKLWMFYFIPKAMQNY